MLHYITKNLLYTNVKSFPFMIFFMLSLEDWQLKFVDPASLAALDKHPGVRPIGIGEVCLQPLSKVVLYIIQNDVLQATSPLQ